MTITIYHNPQCGTSRNTLALIRNTGIEPTVIEYLVNPPTKLKLNELIAAMGMPVRDVIRKNVPPYEDLGLDDPKWSDEELLEFIVTHPILINRPIVTTSEGTRLCRPSELVLDILTSPQLGEFIKEDGEKLIDANGQRVHHAG